MVKKTIKYKDYNDVEREEDFYFDLSAAEITEMELTTEGGMSAYIQKITNTKDMPSLVKLFKELILKSYGVKSPDGRRFMKDEQLSKEFMQTPAYSILFMELATNEEMASAFINGIIPQEALEKQKELADKKN